MTKKSAAGMSRLKPPKGDELGSAACASKASNSKLLGKPGRLLIALVGSGGKGFQGRFDVPLRLAALDGRAQAVHQVQIEGEVVDAVEPEGEQFLRGEEVAQVRAREGAAGVAAAVGVGGARIARVTRGLDLQPAPAREEEPVARHARGKDAVEEIDACQGAAQ